MECAKILALFLFFSSSVWAADFDKEFEDDEKKSWSEIQTQLPAFPEKDNLIPFRVGAITSTHYFVDGKSIVIGEDGVVRYTLVAVSTEGAQNVSYEGIRCATGERRYYAFGRPGKTWSKARSGEWKEIKGTSNNPHIELFSNNFCWGHIVSVKSQEDAIRILRAGGISP